MPKDLLFQAISLLSQYLVDIKEVKGELYHKTACINAEEREMIGMLYAIADLLPDEPELAAFLTQDVAGLFESIGIAKWPRTELTDLGLRVGQKHKVKINLSSDIISDADIQEDAYADR